MNRLLETSLCATMLLAAAVVQADSWKDESGKGKDKHKDKWRDAPSEYRDRDADRRDDRRGRGRGDRADYFHEHGYTQLHIPPGHYPPPGECRVWIPGRPPGHQPPPGNCHRLQYEVPAGAWLIGHPADARGQVQIAVYDEPPPLELQRPRPPLIIGEFDIASGILARVLIEEDPFFYRD